MPLLALDMVSEFDKGGAGAGGEGESFRVGCCIGSEGGISKAVGCTEREGRDSRAMGGAGMALGDADFSERGEVRWRDVWSVSKRRRMGGCMVLSEVSFGLDGEALVAARVACSL